jgi:hypothetical protein
MQDNESELYTDSRIELNQELKLLTLTGEIILVQARRLSLDWRHHRPEFSLFFEVDVSIYQQIYQEEWFGLYPQIRGYGSDVEFEESAPIELRVLLKQRLSDALISRGGDVADLLIYLLKDKMVQEMPVKNTESWLTAEVKQQVELPDVLVETGTLKKGYRTAWMDQAISINDDRNLPVLNTVIETYLEENEWSIERLDESLFRLAIQGEHGDWVTLVQTDEEESRCIVYSVYPELVPEASRTEMAAFLIQENYDLPIGNFEMDLEDGELRVRTSMDLDLNQLTTAVIEQLLTANIAIMDGYFAAIGEQIKKGKN